ncbi:MAG: ATP-binding cassette domain-containing protein [bacterium]
MTSIALEVHDLSVHFGGMTALDRIRLRVRDRQLRCLIGPNGAGKSTFFKCLTGILRPDDGRILLRGEECTALRPHQIANRGVSIKTQVPSVMDGLTVRENIWLAARRKYAVAESNRMTEQMIQRFELGDIIGKLLNQLAHGKRQLVEFAMALATEPWLVLLDEPVAGMSGSEVELIASIIREINQTATVIVVEHDMHFIRMLAEHVTVLHQGRILCEGDVDFVLAEPAVRDVYLGRSA